LWERKGDGGEGEGGGDIVVRIPNPLETPGRTARQLAPMVDEYLTAYKTQQIIQANVRFSLLTTQPTGCMIKANVRLERSIRL
jgi:hypothetical protein